VRSSQFKVAFIGEVDSGKSTTLGQILIQSHTVLPSKILDAKKASEINGQEFEPAFLLDSFEIERTQEMTVDITTTTCKIGNTSIAFLDTPGHQHLSSKFIGGAADVDLGILILDAQLPPTEMHFRHLQMLRKVGLRQFAILVNKLNVNAPESHFTRYVESIQNLITMFKSEIVYLAPVDSKRGLGFSNQDFSWSSAPCFFSFLKQVAQDSERPSGLFCTYSKNDDQSYWLSCYQGEFGASKSFYVGDQAIYFLKTVNKGGLESNQSPWIDRVFFQGQNGGILPVTGIICDTKESSRFESLFYSELIKFETLEEGIYTYRNFWSAQEIKLSAPDGSNVTRLAFSSPVQVYNLDNRYNLFTLERNGKMVAIGIPILD
jgi:signal recognition particle receptor subunit beta